MKQTRSNIKVQPKMFRGLCIVFCVLFVVAVFVGASKIDDTKFSADSGKNDRVSKIAARTCVHIFFTKDYTRSGEMNWKTIFTYTRIN